MDDDDEAAAVAAAATGALGQQQPVGTDNEEATNCSETMSTNDDDDDDDEDYEPADEANSRLTGQLCREQQRHTRPSSSVRDRLGTPLRACPSNILLNGAQQQQHYNSRSPRDDIQQSDSGLAAAATYDRSNNNGNSSMEAAAAELTENETATLSLASNAQAPPSYGTATRGDFTCLDASQLNNIVSGTLLGQHQQKQQHLYGCRILTTRELPTNANSGQTAATSEQLASTSTTSMTTITNNIRPLFGSKTIGSGSARMDLRALQAADANAHGQINSNNTEQQTLSFSLAANNGQEQQHRGPVAVVSGQYLSGSASLPRGQFVATLAQHLNSATGFLQAAEAAIASSGADLRQQQPHRQLQQQQQQQHQIDLRQPDNNRAPVGLNWPQCAQQQQQQMALQPTFGAPINHVISACGSAHWQPQTNQYYGATTSANTSTRVAGALPSMAQANAGSSVAVSSAYTSNQVATMQRLSSQAHAQLTSQSSQAQDSTATTTNAATTTRIMDTALRALPFNSQSEAATAAANRNGTELLLAANLPPTSFINTNAATSGSGAFNSFTWRQPTPGAAAAAVESSSMALAHNQLAHQGNVNQGRALIYARSSADLVRLQPTQANTISSGITAVSLRRSDENLERSSRKQQQAYRKRRRHRSSSGRCRSPPESAAHGNASVAMVAQASDGTITAPGHTMSSGHHTASKRTICVATTAVAGKAAPRIAPDAVSSSQAGGSSHKQAISAHCWLIDTSDDQTYASAAQLKQQRVVTAAGDQQQQPKQATGCHESSSSQQMKQSHSSQHLTVAMMRQTQQKHQRLLSGHATLPDSALRYLTPEAQLYGQDITTNLKTNSLKMERILDRNQSAHTTTTLASLSTELRSSGHSTRVQRRTTETTRDGVGLKRTSSSVRQRPTCGASARNSRRQSPSLSSSSSTSGSSTSASSTRPSARSTSELDELECASVRPTTTTATAAVTVKGGSGGPRSNASSNINNASQAGTLVRLSALLSMVSGLVKRGPRCLRVGSSSPGVAVPTNSLSGSLSAPAGSLQAPYTAASLAISSSSSTSAYATGSSHLSSSNLSNPSRSATVAAAASTSRPIHLTQFKFAGTAGAAGIAPSSASTAGSSLFYSSTSGFQAPPSSHAYEYCDASVDVGGIDQETQFGDQKMRGQTKRSEVNSQQPSYDNEHKASLADLASVSSGHTTTTTTSTTTSSSLSSEQTMQAGAPIRGSRSTESRLAHMIMSDHELISAGSDFNNNDHLQANRVRGLLVAGGRSVLPSVVGASALARRRWWWVNLKDWLRRPCKAGGSSGSECGNAGPALPNGRPTSSDQFEAARYRSLRSARPRLEQHSGSAGIGRRNRRRNSPSTLQNVISLAKADRVFRIRLIASIIVSCVLLGLICLLASLVYSRSASQRARLNLLIDDSDYDLSWLWPQSSQASGSAISFIRGKGVNLSSSSSPPPSPYRLLLEGITQTRTSGSGSSGQFEQHHHQLDNSLRAHLMMIERSERLNQFQLTMTHLTNIQLADDNFIDITQLARHLAPPNSSNQADHQQQQQATNGSESAGPNSSNNNIQASTLGDSGAQNAASSSVSSPSTLLPSIQLNEADHDLVGLTLLSNLHWPLVKWRHQSQKSVANFLSFGAHSISFGGTQTMRNLLALMMLAETSSSSSQSPAAAAAAIGIAIDPTGQLRQFARLNSMLRSTSYHVISCSYLLLQTEQQQLHGPNARSSQVKEKFCKLLIARYKQMMLTLSQLDHHHLAKLHNPLEPPAPSSSSESQQQQQLRSSPRTLLGFFLDRLALLDVQSLVESTLASEEEILASSTSEWFDYVINDDDFSPENGNYNIGQAIEFTLRRDLVNNQVADTNDNLPPLTTQEQQTSSPNKWQMKNSLYDFARLVIGEGPLKLNLNLDGNREFQAKFKHLEATNQEAWRELLTHDLLYPWSSYKLPQFAKPIAYDMFLHPNLTTRLVLGMVKIEFKLERPTSYLVLNCDKLNLVDVSLWQKQTPSITISLANQTAQAGSSTAGQQQSLLAPSALKQLPIRRVLTSAKFEQIYIELQDQIEPLSPATSGGNILFSTVSETPLGSESPLGQSKQSIGQQQGGINFGELHLHDVLPKENSFVINISFNKTSLMSSGGARQFGAHQQQRQQEQGLEFVQYGDYFAQPEAEVKTILYTQFEPSNARRLFPCFDEPQFKAKFQLNLVHEQHHQVLFNAQKRERVSYTSDGSIQMSVFEQTPIPLSTYLVAFVVCDSQNIKSITSRALQLQPASAASAGPSAAAIVASFFRPTNQQHQEQAEQKHIQVQILAQFEQLGQAEFASQLVPQLLAFYQSHLQFPYPLDKLDLIAIPRALPGPLTMETTAATGATTATTFSLQQLQGADTMENMGLIWFKAPLLLLDTNLISQNLIEQIAMIIAHQLAHQYFGNIISVRNWQDLWLYEALCQYLESIALNSVQADWRLEEQFVVTNIQDSLAIDQFEPTSASALVDSQQPLDWLAAPAAADIGGGTGSNIAEVDDSSSSAEFVGNGAETSTGKNSAGSANSAPVGGEGGGQQLHLDQSKATEQDLLASDLGKIQEQLAGLNIGVAVAASTRTSGAAGKLTASLSPNELKRSSALLHMLLFNLLPSSEAQARLLRRCLARYRYRTMSRHQFWRQFGLQLAQEASFDRLSLDWPLHLLATSAAGTPLTSAAAMPTPAANFGANYLALSPEVGWSEQQQHQLAGSRARNLTLTADGQQGGTIVGKQQQPGAQSQAPGERIVFVWPTPRDRKRLPVKRGPVELEQQGAIARDDSVEISGVLQVEARREAHEQQQRARSNLVVGNLDLVAAAWLGQRGYPLVSATVYRERVQLRQERFSFAWWSEPSVSEDEETLQAKWPSRLGQVHSSDVANVMLADSPQVPSGKAIRTTSGRFERSPTVSVTSVLTNNRATAANEPELEVSAIEDEQVWPIPLMFVSRFNPKVARFFWMSQRQMELPLSVDPSSSLSSQDFSSAASTGQLARETYNERGVGNSRGGKVGHSNWFKLNVNQSSLVRVNYDERNWEALTELLAKSHYSNHLLSALDRANLIDDSFTLMRCGKLSVGIAMNLTLYLEVGEREYMPWTSALRHLDQMQTLLNQNPLWHRYVLKLTQPISSVIGWKDDGPHLMRKLRRSLFSVALQYGDEKILSKAKQEFKSWLKNGRFIVPNLQELVYVAGVRYGDQQEWFYCWQKYQQLVAIDLNGVVTNGASGINGSPTNSLLMATNHTDNNFHGYRSGDRQSATLFAATGSLIGQASSSSSAGGLTGEPNEPNAENDKRQLLTALASTQNTWLLEQFLNYSLDSTKIQPHHLKHVMQTLGKNPVARLYLWRFVRLNWLTLIDKYLAGSGEHYDEQQFLSSTGSDRKRPQSSAEYHQVLETMVLESTKHFATKLDYEEVKAFFDNKRKHYQQQRFNMNTDQGLPVVVWSPSLERAIQQSLQVIRSNIYWRDIIEPKLTKWLSHYDSSIIN